MNYKHKFPGNKPYFFFGDYLREKYGCRVLKLPINAGLTCPNRDGTTGQDGCIFCSAEGSSSPTAGYSCDITAQMDNARVSFTRADEKTKYIAYFQAFTNTYAEDSVLRELFDRATAAEDVIGLMIGTRPDCVPDNIIELISSYAKENFELTLEIGMQTMHNKSLEYLNRGHTHEATRDCVLRAAEKNIPVCLHIILGIPGESWEDMMNTAKEVSSLPASGVKIHHLHVIRGTKLEDYYREGKFETMTFNKYISTAADFIERLRPDIMIHRLLGDRDESTLTAPKWGLHKGTVIKAIEDEFRERCTWQGFLEEKNGIRRGT